MPLTSGKAQKTKSLMPRAAPIQGRSKAKAVQIIYTASELLERVGLDEFSTSLVAEEMNISIGTLYHYFPNKHAILYAMGSRWLTLIDSFMDEIARWPIETMNIEMFVNDLIDGLSALYKQQKALLFLSRAMFSLPDLQKLDEAHNTKTIITMAELFKRLGVRGQIRERERLGELFLELGDRGLMMIASEKGQRAKRSSDDLKLVLCELLKPRLLPKGS
ncbi:TetR/AcrR family transcriptional regulator [Aliamphritea hakodatensis]|uniref:TetR/AcrR family transcriptional regulator n=1 Tax=Aliamphritea hakodatensis TaxID=2895352 RepID=UPI0022FD85F0|nr:TetR/AcrR family transcriptional regulator [Aliamphritea hakodatensis]